MNLPTLRIRPTRIPIRRCETCGLNGFSSGTESFVNYHWNWRIFWEPAPNGTGTYLDMLLSGWF